MSAGTLRERVARALLHEGDGLRITAADIAIALCREEFARVALNSGFIQAQDTEWDEGVNYAKRFIADAIRKHEVGS